MTIKKHSFLRIGGRHTDCACYLLNGIAAKAVGLLDKASGVPYDSVWCGGANVVGNLGRFMSLNAKADVRITRYRWRLTTVSSRASQNHWTAKVTTSLGRQTLTAVVVGLFVSVLEWSLVSGQEPPVTGVQDEDGKPKVSLEKQWEDYLLSPVTAGDRQWALDAMTEAERAELTTVLKKTTFQLDAIAAQVYIKRICEMGPRISGSTPMAVQQAALKRHFKGLGYSVASQSFDIPHPETRANTTLTNLIVQLHPERKLRILICCHYDTRPFADRDPVNPRALLEGANDGASGVALLMVMAPHLKELGPRLGIDLVFFDAEELIYVRERDKLFLGSTHFAEQYVNSPPEHRYRAGVLIDMIADRTLELYHEKNSLKHAGPLTKQIWLKAQKLGIKDFVAKPKHEVRDDHIPLNEIAMIPTTDLIDFDYPSMNSAESYWHTTKDTVDKCSPLSMAKVGVVLLEWAKDYVK